MSPFSGKGCAFESQEGHVRLYESWVQRERAFQSHQGTHRNAAKECGLESAQTRRVCRRRVGIVQNQNPNAEAVHNEQEDDSQPPRQTRKLKDKAQKKTASRGVTSKGSRRTETQHVGASNTPDDHQPRARNTNSWADPQES